MARKTSMKYRNGLRYVSVCAQGGMLEIGVISPLVKIKMMRKKKFSLMMINGCEDIDTMGNYLFNRNDEIKIEQK